MKCLLLLAVSIATIHSFPYFQANIPNGQAVPNPCDPGTTWPGVGHENKAGGGDRNPFGAAFLAAGMTWTEDLCKADSDGDGKSNGVELGDPDCTFKQGTVNEAAATGHPGICEPLDDEDCKEKNSWLSC